MLLVSLADLTLSFAVSFSDIFLLLIRDLGLVSFAMGNWEKGYQCFNLLSKESNWSKVSLCHFISALAITS